MRYFVLFVFVLFALSGTLVSKDYLQPNESVKLQDKAPVLLENDTNVNYSERGILAAPPQFNSIVFDYVGSGLIDEFT